MSETLTVDWYAALTSKQLKQASIVVLALSLSFLWDARFSPADFRNYLPGYGALVVEAVSSAALEHTQSVLSPSLGQPVAQAVSLLGACVFSLPLYMLRHLLVCRVLLRVYARLTLSP